MNFPALVSGLFVLLLFGVGAAPAETSAIPENFRRENLVAWCIVPFDGTRETPEARAKMLKNLGLKRVAYDWREAHVPEFEQEFLACKQHGIEFFAFWKGHEDAYPLMKKYGVQPQIWHPLQTGKGLSNKEKVSSAAEALVPLATRTREAGLSLGLYNRGGWGGLPDNLVAVCKALRGKGFENVGIVYNFHHAHLRIADFEEDLQSMMPYLLCLNLNGMADPAVEDVAKADVKVKPIGTGAHEREMIETTIAVGYKGPVGVIGPISSAEVEAVLRENLEGLEQILSRLP